MCVYAMCFKISGTLFPEFGSLVRAVVKSIFFVIDHMNSSEKEKLPALKQTGSPQHGSRECGLLR
jgi:hypothetical protein